MAANREIAIRLHALREQIGRIHKEITFLAALVDNQLPDEEFKIPDVKDRLTTLTIAVRNNAAEMDKLWKLTRQ